MVLDPQAASTIGGIEESAERTRRQEVSRALASMALPLEEETAIERMSRSLVVKLLSGPISEVITCAEGGTSPHDQRGRRADGPETGRVARARPRPRLTPDSKPRSAPGLPDQAPYHARTKAKPPKRSSCDPGRLPNTDRDH